ncbi:hypothetical protein DFS34DRAFT_170496 [Phlyctochytrium arcticum]|nr:hypothetical protein DFS34DRAFT_170496 [Phlyctochytrium arcticum]
MGNETLSEVLARHKKEVKDLQGKVTALKKSVGGNKQKKKEVQAEIVILEKQLEQRHETEKATAEKDSPTSSPAEEPANSALDDDFSHLTLSSELDETSSLPPTPNPAQEPPSERSKKPNKAKLRKLRKEAEFAEQRKLAAEEAAEMTNHKKLEDQALERSIENMGLEVQRIAPDGHCMYNALSDQISRVSDEKKSYRDLRREAAAYLRSHADDFMPFMVSKEGDMLTKEEYEKYCDSVAETAEWGGQPELRALSQSLRREIHVIQANSPPIKLGEEFASADKTPLIISYHRHYFGLGEHYNSLRPSTARATDGTS